MSSSAALPADQTEIATSLPTLTSTRLYPPRLRTNLVERSSLIARLSDPERRLTVITAGRLRQVDPGRAMGGSAGVADGLGEAGGDR